MTKHTLSLEIDYAHESAGWIICALTIDSERHTLEASNVLPPFLHLLYFVKAAAGQSLPYKFFWDEEGYGADFEITEAAENSPLVHLKIMHGILAPAWFDADIERETIIQAFLPPLVDLAQNFALVESEWSMPRQIVDNVQRAIAKGIPLQSNIHMPKHVDFIIYATYGHDFTEDFVCLQIWLDDVLKLHYNVRDTDLFWPQLVEFLGKTANGDFPAQLEYSEDMRSSLLGALVPAIKEAGFERKQRIVASAADTPENFRLQDYIIDWQSQSEVLSMDEPINRQQCVRGFVQSFGDFLRDIYQVSVDENGNIFDLRTLSLEKLGQS